MYGLNLAIENGHVYFVLVALPTKLENVRAG